MKGIVSSSVIFSTGGLLFIMYGFIAWKAYLRKKQQLSVSRTETRVIKNSVAVTLSFIFCTFPVALADLGMSKDFSSRYGLLCGSFVAVKLFLDPMLYYFVSLLRAKKEARKRMHRFSSVLNFENKLEERNEAKKYGENYYMHGNGLELEIHEKSLN